MTLGTLLRKAGFRWVFPIGTLPVPYHPIFLFLCIFGPPAWIVWMGWSALAGADDGLRWWQPLLIALGLGLPLSIPIVGWVMLLFRAHLAQAVLIGGSMLLLAIEVATGQVHMLWAALPVGFVLLYLVQRIGGRIILARLRREADAWQPLDPGERTVAVDGEPYTGAAARPMLEQCNITRIVSIPGKPRRGMPKARVQMLHRLSAEAVEELRRTFGGKPPKDWTIPKLEHVPIVGRPLTEVPNDCIMVSMQRYRSLLWIIGGKLMQVRVRDGAMLSDLVHGNASVIGKWPLFTVFYLASLTGQGTRHIGFAREKPVRLGESGNIYMPLIAALVPRPADGGRIDDRFMASDDSGLSGLMRAAEAEAQAQIDAFWNDMALYPGWGAGGPIVDRLRSNPRLFRPGDGKRLAAWLKACKTKRHKVNATSAAILLEHLPDDEFLAAKDDIVAALNSRILAGEWRIGPDMDLKDVPKECPRFGEYGGFGLLYAVPGLYARVASLGPGERRLIDGLSASLPQHSPRADQ